MANRDMSGLAGTLDAPAGQTAQAAIRLDSTPAVTVDSDVQPTVTTPAAKSVVKWAAGIVFAALLLLWLFGGIVFKNANL